MSASLLNQLAFEGEHLGHSVFAIQFTPPAESVPPSLMQIQQITAIIEAHLGQRGAEVGPPIVRISGRNTEICISLSGPAIDEITHLFSALERFGFAFRAARLLPPSDWILVYPLESTEPFTLLAEPVAAEDRLALLSVEIERLSVLIKTAEANGRTNLIAHIQERMEAVKSERFRLKIESCGGQS